METGVIQCKCGECDRTLEIFDWGLVATEESDDFQVRAPLAQCYISDGFVQVHNEQEGCLTVMVSDEVIQRLREMGVRETQALPC